VKSKPKRSRPPRLPTATTPLTPKQQRFVVAYLVDRNGARAAVLAGYAARSAKVAASRLLTKVNVRAAVDRAQADWIDRTKITAERVAHDIDVAANLDMAELFDARGNLLPVVMMPPHVRRAIQSVEVVKRNLTSGDGKVDEIWRIKLIDKGRMHEVLGRHTGVDKGDGQNRPTVPAFALPVDTPGVSVH
jgi:phage terminase small subunit